MKAWIDDHDIQFKGSYGYSDSINDLPMLDAVDRPFAGQSRSCVGTSCTNAGLDNNGLAP